MVDYIVCQKKRNSPRLSIRICIEKCPEKDDCAQFKAIYKNYRVQNESSHFPESHAGSALSTA